MPLSIGETAGDLMALAACRLCGRHPGGGPWARWSHRGMVRPPRLSTGNLASFCLWSIRSGLQVCRRRTSNAYTPRPPTEARAAAFPNWWVIIL
jgi:hypothetical protein